MAHNFIPMANSLFRKNISTIISCPLCDGEARSVLHLFWQCHFEVDIWNKSGLFDQIPVMTFPNSRTWLQSINDCLSQDAFELCALICWNIWLARDSMVFNHCVPLPVAVLHEANSCLSDWQPPNRYIVKVNLEGALREMRIVEELQCSYPRGEDLLSIEAIIEDCQCATSYFSSCSFKFFKSSGNALAHAFVHLEFFRFVFRFELCNSVKTHL
ncbi:hypothetical protein CDL12_18986 [Handroanthus impetiginosus]|uniref:Uncharacterized protein n=1 Tax=Handroanthus impetiginosus TaxID=429701 RepID=A0A2G9GT24_9LAMI|nr:hypothetical protein CDL12_18986 [Handroanthus impetiginosus]